MPWAPIYLAIIFLMHSLLGYLALVAGIVLTIIAILTEQLDPQTCGRNRTRPLRKRVLRRINAGPISKWRPYSAWSGGCAALGECAG